MENKIVIYGAYGHTGKFLVAQLYQQGFKPVLSGRDADKLNALSKDYPDLITKVADINQPETLDKAFADAEIIVNCAGPFLDTAEPIIQSTLRLGKHYLDVSAEQKAVLDIFEQFSEQAKIANVIIIPAAAFYGGLADLLSTTLTKDWDQVDEISSYIGLDSWHPTKGTRLTGERNHYQRFMFENNSLQPVLEVKSKVWDFPEPIATQEVVTVPLSEIITISRHINVNTINTYLSQNSLTDIRNDKTPEPKAADEKNRSNQVFCMEVVATKGNKSRSITAQGIDIYAVTAPLIVEALKRILTGKIQKQGVTTLGEAFDATDFLNALDTDDIVISEIKETEIN
ncbi:saccharopine dehydrogenase NADP-binding domain-containing protein [uncultured Flavobacterium sp.]|uniref:saccharopine dehydrogenase family protein n=1 Tax=uncultured Flavobacterium sp. TaxID=165435 RepID=UPI0030819FD8